MAFRSIKCSAGLCTRDHLFGHCLLSFSKTHATGASLKAGATFRHLHRHELVVAGLIERASGFARRERNLAERPPDEISRGHKVMPNDPFTLNNEIFMFGRLVVWTSKGHDRKGRRCAGFAGKHAQCR